MNTSKNIAIALLGLLDEGKSAAEVTKDFMNFVQDRKLASQLPEIVRQMEKLQAERSKEKEVSIRTPYEVSKTLEKHIAEKMNAPKDTGIRTEIDETLIGGFVATYKGLEYDASLKKQLAQLQASLTQ